MKQNIYVTKSSLPKKEEYFKEIESIWDCSIMTNMGEKHQILQRELEDYLHVPHISLFSNGHMALELCIQAMKLSGEVITTPFTFASTTHAIVRNGLKPVFCDINREDYTIDVSKIESLITPRTSAILPVHVYGNICDVDTIQQIAEQYKLKVIYDAAHAFGEVYKGIGVANYGDASMLSFHATKVFNTIEGGGICYQNESLGETLYSLKNFGIKSEIAVEGIGANAKMNEFQAAMGICNLRHIDNAIQARKYIVERYEKNLKNLDTIFLSSKQLGLESNYSYFPIVFDDKKKKGLRDIVYSELKKHDIYARKYFYPLTSEFECYKKLYDSTQTPTAMEISRNILTLPLYETLEIEMVDEICCLIKKIIARN